jgi:hypothetical protein
MISRILLHAKLLHIVLIHLSCYILRFTVPSLRAETADAGRTELADGVSNMGGLLELL